MLGTLVLLFYSPLVFIGIGKLAEEYNVSTLPLSISKCRCMVCKQNRENGEDTLH